LPACNAAISERPLFPEDQRSKSLRLEDGLWYLMDSDCDVTIALPTDQWPGCAQWAIVRGDKIVRWSDSDSSGLPLDIFLVDGRPPLIQAQINTKDPRVAYGYFALQSGAQSAGHRVTTLRLWPVPCGKENPSTGKVDPYPGFTKECLTTSASAVRAAAKKIGAAEKPAGEWRWVRAEN
jgi:hypothetical protein